MPRRTERSRTWRRCRILKGLSLMVMRRRDELARAGAMLDEGFMAEARATTMHQEREEVYHAAENQFERFRGFLELISRFEFEFRRR